MSNNIGIFFGLLPITYYYEWTFFTAIGLRLITVYKHNFNTREINHNTNLGYGMMYFHFT